MRYWIWWNDLTQGPFELEELTSLKAFSEDLLVCMEDRQEWIPASRIADLSSAVEQLRDRRATVPFHFSHPPTVTRAAVLDLPRPEPQIATMAPPPVIRESPVRKPKEEPQPIPLNVIETEVPPSLAPSFDEEVAVERKPN